VSDHVFEIIYLMAAFEWHHHVFRRHASIICFWFISWIIDNTGYFEMTI
jgi:hypothetical protein